jgi:hypothetical protein
MLYYATRELAEEAIIGYKHARRGIRVRRIPKNRQNYRIEPYKDGFIIIRAS